MSRSPLPRWGEKAKASTRLGATVWGVSVAVGWAVRLVAAAVGGQVPAPVAWAVGVLVASAFALMLLAGIAWLAAEFVTGLREPPQPD